MPQTTELSARGLLEEARAQTGLTDTGAPAFTDTLQTLIASCEQTAALNDTGWSVLAKSTRRHLRNRLSLQAALRANPSLARAGIRGPIVITGLPRTGTTLLHHLLALDPAHRVLRGWEALHPVPPAAGGPSEASLVEQAESWLAGLYRLVPGFEAIHAATAHSPEECDPLFRNTFAGWHFEIMFDARAYSAWLARADLTAEYADYATQLRVLAGADETEATWVVKWPGHLGHLDALLATFPDAIVVHCHRHPREAIPSFASLVRTVREAYSDAVSPAAIGPQWLSRWAAATDRALRAREAAPERFVDVAYHALAADPVAEVRGVYQRLGRSLDPAAEDRMRAWLADNPRHKHGVHRYRLEQFGLSEDGVQGAFSEYLRHFFAEVAA